jgi:hypothetical protein
MRHVTRLSDNARNRGKVNAKGKEVCTYGSDGFRGTEIGTE